MGSQKLWARDFDLWGVPLTGLARAEAPLWLEKGTHPDGQSHRACIPWGVAPHCKYKVDCCYEAFVLHQNSRVDIITPNAMVSGGEHFGR